MSWDELLGQAAVKRYLQSALRSGRLAHAYLFEGPAGVGKRSAALLLARVLLCTRRPAPGEACGACRSCRWIAARQGLRCAHPDLILPIKFDAQGRMTEQLVGAHEPNLALSTIQYMAEQLHRAPMNGPRRVALIPEAQRLCHGQAESANAFLKTLEEPPRSGTVLLTSSRPEALLDTIVSRCQPLRFRRLSLDEVRRGLAQGARHTEAERALAASLAAGSLGRALDLLGGDLKRWREAVQKELHGFGAASSPRFGLTLWRLAEEEGARLFEAEKAAGAAPLPDPAEDGAETPGDEAGRKTEAGWKRFVFGRLLELCEATFRDVLLCAAGAEEALWRHADQAPLVEKLAARFGVEGGLRVLEALREAFLAARLYVRGDLVGRVLAGRMAAALGGCKERSTAV